MMIKYNINEDCIMGRQFVHFQRDRYIDIAKICKMCAKDHCYTYYESFIAIFGYPGTELLVKDDRYYQKTSGIKEMKQNSKLTS